MGMIRYRYTHDIIMIYDIPAVRGPAGDIKVPKDRDVILTPLCLTNEGRGNTALPFFF